MASLGRYELIETLGQGGMGTIHLAVVGGLGRFRKLVVLKVLRDELTSDPKFVEMFMREAALAACLSHPNVVQTVEAGQAEGRYFLVMEFLDGQPYSRLLRNAARDPTLPLALRLHVLCEALLGLHYAHELRGYDGRALHLVHRDVSPPNIFVTYDGQVKLLDFGIANARDGEGSHPGEFKGKLGYAAPEQLRGVPADRRIDVFAAGVVLWESIALRQIAQGTPTREVFAARLAGTEPRISEVMPGLDPALALICDRAMHPEPEARYASADDFRAALWAYLTDRELLVDGSVISQYMHTKFASVRAAMHRRIDAHSKEGPEPDAQRSLDALAGLHAGSPASAYVPAFGSPSPARVSFAPSPTYHGAGSDEPRTAIGSRFAQHERRSAFESSSARDYELLARSALKRRARRTLVRRVAVVLVTSLFVAGSVWLARGSRHHATAESLARPDTLSSATATAVAADAGPPEAPDLAAKDQLPPPLPSGISTPTAKPFLGGERTHRARHRERAEAGAEPAVSRSRVDEARGTTRDAAAAAASESPTQRDPTDLRRVPRRERRQLDVDNPFQ